jgi:transposase-like protein
LALVPTSKRCADHRHGSRRRSLTGTFGPIEIAVPRARLNTPEGKTSEWKSQALRAYQRRTLAADALIASTYLAGMRAEALSRKPGNVGAVAFSRTGDPAIGEFGDAKVIRKFGEVPEDLSTL